ncbi:serine protease [Spirochaetota bacterium]|nr:serine protease [Spirochaetota bacterium]
MERQTLKLYLITACTGFFSMLAGAGLVLYLLGYPLTTIQSPAALSSEARLYTEAPNDSVAVSGSNRSIVNIAAYDKLSDKELSSLSLQNAFNHVAKQAIPAVVSIQVTAKRSGNNPYGQFSEEFFQKFFGQRPRTPQREVTSAGSGFVINKDGYIVSNYHVIKDASSVAIFFSDHDKEYKAKVVGVDPDTDIALLKIEKERGDFPFLPLGNSDTVETGDIVIAIGNPFGLSHTFTTGVISAKGRTGIANKYENFIQTDTAINPGNSGGPLLNLRGEVIGINSNILSRTQSYIGLGFSIPINIAKSVVSELRSSGKVVRGWLGIYYQDITKDVADALATDSKGVIVERVVEKSPAEKAGIKAGDIIKVFNNKVLRDGKDLLFQISKLKVGATVPLKVLREGKTLSKRVRLEKQDEVAVVSSSAKPSKPQANEQKFRSIFVRDMNNYDLKTYNQKKPFGVVITKLEENSPLTYYGISNGDVIEAVNRKPTPSVDAFKKAIAKAGKKDKILFQIRSQASVYYIVSNF